jgi:suppressor of ftsI
VKTRDFSRRRLAYAAAGAVIAVGIGGGVFVVQQARLGGHQAGSADHQVGSADQQKGSTDLLAYRLPQDLEPAGATSEVRLADGETYALEAGFISGEVNGVVQPMLAYNGSTPGPTLIVRQGDTVTVDFRNELNMQTAVHAHGLRQDVAMDGVPGTSQPPVEVGESFRYEWSFPDAGVYWYHPHIREDYQQGAGLYGAIVVEPADDSYWPEADVARPLVLSDALVDPDTGRLVPFEQDEANRTLMGRYGNVSLLNGVTDWQETVAQNSVQRFYVVNASNARPYRFALAGTRMKVIGSDIGRVGNERFVEAVTLGPGERVVIDVLFDTVGTVAVQNAAPGAESTLGTITVSPSAPATAAAVTYGELRVNQDTAAEIAALAGKVVSSKRLVLDMSMDGMEGMDTGGGHSEGHAMPDGSTMDEPKAHTMPDGTVMDSQGNAVDPATVGIEWADDEMNLSAQGVRWFLTDPDTGLSGSDIDWTFDRGDVVRITIENKGDSAHPMQHPMHLHGQRFAVTGIDGRPTTDTDTDWKDTVTIPAGQTYELLVEMSNPGTWMLHCHISEHLEAGMHMDFTVR